MEDERRIREKKGSEATSTEQSLKVGIHEWIMVDLTVNNPIKLWTSGLIGCVAVAIVTPTHAFVTHISSNISAKDWENTVKNQFSEVIGKIADIDKAIECRVVGGEDLGLFEQILKSVGNIMEQKTNDDCKISFSEGGQGVTGVSAYLGEFGPRIQVIKGKEEEPPFSKTLNSVTGTQYFKLRGIFTCADGGPATLSKD
jgi:hypothetical protein